jgi:outer membrane protein
MGNTARANASRKPARLHWFWVRAVIATIIMCSVTGGVVRGQSLSPASPAQIRSTPEPSIVVGLGTRLELTLRDAIERALRENLDLRAARYDLDIGDLRIAGARGAYDPQAGFSIGRASSSTPTTSILQGGGIATQVASSQTFGPTISQLLPSGGTINASFPTTKASTNDAFSFVDPLFSSDLAIAFQQPLLRGLVNNPVRHELRDLSFDSKITETQFRQAVAEIVQRVEEQYWGLVYADAVRKVREESRDLAARQRDQISQKVEAGLLAPGALTSASAELAGRDQDTLQADVLVVASQNGLKQLLAGDPSAPIWSERLVPIDRPEIRDPPASLSEALHQALERRPELARLGLQTEQRRADRQFANWETKPRLDLSGSFTSIGRAGQVFRPIFDPSGGITPVGREPDPTHPAFGGYRQAWSQVFESAYPQWQVLVDVRMPIFNREAEAQVAQVDVSLHQLDLQVKAQQQVIMVEVANAYETVLLQRRVLDVARQARQLSQEQVDGEMARFDVGFTTTFEVLRYQRDLAEAQVRELRAIIDYQIAVAALRKATGINFDEHDVTLAKTAR